MVDAYCLGAGIELIEVTEIDTQHTYRLIDTKKDREIGLEVWKEGDGCWVSTRPVNPVRGEIWRHQFFDRLPKKYAALGI